MIVDWLTISIFICIIITHIIFILCSIVLPIYYTYKQYDYVKRFLHSILFMFGLGLFYFGVIIGLYMKYNFTLYDYLDYMYTFSQVSDIDRVQIVIFILVLNWDSFLLLISFVVNTYIIIKNKTPDIVYDTAYEHQHAFIVACHNSSDKIDKTIQSLLKKIPPHCIFIADNGSIPLEATTTKNIANSYNTNYYNILKGNKSTAQFIIANIIKINHTKIKYISAMDDDTVLPANWSFKHIRENYFTQEDVVCIAYPLMVHNRTNLLTECENLEYGLSAQNKIMQSTISTTIFASGGFSTWELDWFLEVISRHNTVFNGEDFQLGLITHMLYNKKWLTQNHISKISPKIKVCSDIYFETFAPSHWFHTYDFITNNHPCECAEGSLYEQRARSWDLTRQRFILNFLKVIFSRGKICWNTIWIKILMINECILIVSDWSSLIYIIVFGFVFGRWDQLLRTFWLSLFWSFPLLSIYSTSLLLKFNIPYIITCSFTILYKLPLNTLLKYDAMFYAVITQILGKNKIPPTIAEQLSTDNTISLVIQNIANSEIGKIDFWI